MDEIINEIEQIRVRNNKCWMDLLRIAFRSDPVNAGQIMKKITNNDRKISKLTEKLAG